MDLLFNRIFLNSDGSLKGIDALFNSVIIIPEIVEAPKVKFYIKEFLKANNIAASFIPEITTLYDIARGLTDIMAGEQIRIEDFRIILEHDEKYSLPARFRDKKFRSYKNHLFMLLNLISLCDEEFCNLNLSDLEKIDFTEKEYNAVVNLIHENGYFFKGDIYKKALSRLDDKNNSGYVPGKTYFLLEQGFYSKLEKNFLERINGKSAGISRPVTEGKFRGILNAMLDDDHNLDDNGDQVEYIAFLEARSSLEQAVALKHDMLKKMETDQKLDFNDFCIVCFTDESVDKFSSYFGAESIPFNSSSSANSEEGLYICLQALLIGIRNDILKAVDFFNHFIQNSADSNIVSMDLKDSKDIFDIESVLSELYFNNPSNLSINKINPDVKEKLKTFLKILIIKNHASPRDTDKILGELDLKIKGIQKLLSRGGGRFSLFSYKNVLKKIFKDKLSLAEAIEYLSEITKSGSREKISKAYNGINIIKPDELYFGSKILYLVDLEENKFLRNNYYNKLLDEEKFLELEKAVYGMNKEDFIKDRFTRLLTCGITGINFLIPNFGEETVISFYIENLLRIYPKKECRIEVAGNREIKIENLKFYISPYDLIDKGNSPGTVDPVIYEEKTIDKDYSLSINAEIDLVRELNSASKIERFCKCPARFANELKLNYGRIDSPEIFTAGNIFHEAVEKFIAYCRGKDIIIDEDEMKLLTDVFKNKKVDEFVKYYLLKNSFISSQNPGFEFGSTQEKYVFNKFESLINDSEVIPLFAGYMKNELGKDVNKKGSLNRELINMVRFLVNLTIDIGVSPRRVTESFRTEVLIHDFSIGAKNIRIFYSFIDFIFIDYNRNLRVIDFKSGKISEYKEEMKNYHIVQLLIYKEAVKKALLEKNFSCFSDLEIKGELEKKEYSTVGEDYFAEYLNEGSGSPEIKAYYVSNRKGQFKMAVEEDFGVFLETLDKRTGRENVFFPESNKECRYCSLLAACEMFDESNIDLDHYRRFFEIDTDNLFDRYEILKANDEEIGKNNGISVKRFIQFSGDKECALIANSEDMIISASAGSGKTELLSAKYVKLLLDEKIYVENIVALTFTNKAVGEMENRIIRKLNETIESGYFFAVKQDDPERYRLTDEKIRKLKKAKSDFYHKNRIRTFHSFCRNILEKYSRKSSLLASYDLESEIAPDYFIIEEKIEILKKANRGNYNEFFDGNEISAEEKNIFYNWLSFQPFYYSNSDYSCDFVNEILSLVSKINLSGKNFDDRCWDFSPGFFKKQKQEILANLEGKYKKLKNDALNLVNGLNREKEKIYELRLDLEKEEYSKAKNLRKRGTDNELEIANLKKIKDAFIDLKEMKNIYFSEGPDTTKIELAIRKAIFFIASGVNRKINEFKSNCNCIEQEDFHLLLIRLLESDPIAREELREEFKYFLLDEFQDTNWLQNKIIGLLHEKGRNFIFIVGDLKQSIYRFQQCDNQIFHNYLFRKDFRYLSFADNYRSNPGIVDFNNYYFSENDYPNYNIFNSGGKNGAELARSITGNGQPASICFTQICYDKDRYKDASQAELNQITKIQEARYICNIIRKNHGLKWGILIRAYTRVDYLIETLKESGIPYSFIMKKGLFELKEVIEFISLIKIIYNVKLWSELSYIDNIKNIIDEIHSGGLLDNGILYVSLYALSNPVYQAHLAKFINYEQKKQNLIQLIEIINEAVAIVGNNALEILTYLDKSAEYNSKGITSYTDRSVKIMTVHSAKGLEFDNIVVANISSREQGDSDIIKFVNIAEENNNKIDFTVKGFKDILGNDNEELRFWYSYWMDEKNKEFEEKENANLLYVALTRAKKNIYVTMIKNALSNIRADSKKNSTWFGNFECNLFDKAYNEYETGSKVQMLNNRISVMLNRLPIENINLLSDEDVKKSITVEKKYPVKKTPIKNLISVTDLLTDAAENVFDGASYSTEKLDFEPADLGIAVHSFFEKYVEILINDQSIIKALFNEFLNSYKNNISEKLMINAQNLILNAINNNDFIKLFDNSLKVITEGNIFFKSDIDEFDFIEGVIDLLIFKKDEIIILDYKTDLLKDEVPVSLMKHYMEQVKLYERGIGRIFSGTKISKFLFIMNRKSTELVLV